MLNIKLIHCWNTPAMGYSESEIKLSFISCFKIIFLSFLLLSLLHILDKVQFTKVSIRKSKKKKKTRQLYLYYTIHIIVTTVIKQRWEPKTKTLIWFVLIVLWQQSPLHKSGQSSKVVKKRREFLERKSQGLAKIFLDLVGGEE